MLTSAKIGTTIPSYAANQKGFWKHGQWKCFEGEKYGWTVRLSTTQNVRYK